MKNIYISAIVPAYNEEKNIERVINDLLKISFLSEIIVIDDGSVDGTKNILENFIEFAKIKFVSNFKNQGKGYSVARGLEVSNGEIILILDADVINYTEFDLSLLIKPLLDKQCDFSMRVSQPKFLSGIRAYWRKDIFLLKEEMKNTTKYGLEVLLNTKLNKKGKFVVLKDCKHFQKFEKYIFPVALWEYLKEGVSILIQLVR